MKEITKLQKLLDERQELKERSLRLDDMKTRIKVGDRPKYLTIGWFDRENEYLTRSEVSLFYDFLSEEKYNADTRILEINQILEKLDKEL